MTVNFRELPLFRLISLDALIAVILRTSSSSTATNLSPIRNLSDIGLVSFKSCITGAQLLGLSSNIPNAVHHFNHCKEVVVNNVLRLGDESIDQCMSSE